MTQEVKDVNEESQASPETSAGEQEQAEVVSEDVNTQEADSTEEVEKKVSNYKQALEKEEARYKEALKNMRTQRKEAEQAYQPNQTQPQPVGDTETTDVEKQWSDVLHISSKVPVLEKMISDPTFKDRQHLVLQEMQLSGKGIEDADNAVLARMMKESITSVVAEPVNQPTQLRSTATPEQRQVNAANVYDKINKGEVKEGGADYLQRLWKKNPTGS
jgi:hypothetical protein